MKSALLSGLALLLALAGAAAAQDRGGAQGLPKVPGFPEPRSSAPAPSGSARTNRSPSTVPGGKTSRPATAIGKTNRLISSR